MSDCPQCKRRLGAKTSCKCGYVMPGGSTYSPGSPPVKVIACVHLNCIEPAICSIFTKTGWANVCRPHYPTIERAAYSSNSLVMKELRKAYEGSYDYRRRHGLEKGARPDRAAIDAELAEVKRRMEAARPAREPGQDDEGLALCIGRDPLEAEFQNEGAR